MPKYIRLAGVDGTDPTTPRLPIVPPMRVTLDAFTRADSTLGGSVADDGDTNLTWSIVGAGAPSWSIVANRAKPTAGNGSALALLDPGQANVTIEATLAALHSTSSRRTGIVFRAQDVSNHYRWWVNPTDAKWTLIAYVAGAVAATLYTGATAAAGDRPGVQVEDGVATLFLNDAQVGTPIALTQFPSATKVGLFGARYATDGTTAQESTSAWSRFSATYPA